MRKPTRQFGEWRAWTGHLELIEIVRIIMASTDEPSPASELIEQIIDPSIRKARDKFLASLDAITVYDLCAAAVAQGVLE